jgi:hypothetical protein
VSWILQVVCERQPEPLPKTGESIGLDFGIKDLVSDSAGGKVGNPIHLKRWLRKLRVARAQDFTTDQRKSKTQEGVSDCGAYSRKDFKSTARLLAQDGASVRQRLRQDISGRFKPVEHGWEPLFSEVNSRRILGDAARNDRSQGRMRRADGHRGATAFYEPVVFGVWGNRSEGVERANARLSALWLLGLPGYQCGQEYTKAGTRPSGRDCNSGLDDLRSTGFIL